MYRGTLLTRNRSPLNVENPNVGLCLGSYGDGRFLMSEVPLYRGSLERVSLMPGDPCQGFRDTQLGGTLSL